MMMQDPGLPVKKPILEKRDSPFASSAERVRSYQEEAAVAPELRSRLESIGMRTRFNVSRGYGSPPPSQAQEHFDGASSVFASGNQILQSVENTRSRWNRTKSAPLHYQSNELTPFCGHLTSPLIVNDDNNNNENDGSSDYASLHDKGLAKHEQDVQGGVISHHHQGGNSNADSQDGAMGVGLFMTDLKRNRDDIFGEFMAEGEEGGEGMHLDDNNQVTTKLIAALPKRGSPKSSSSMSRPAVSSFSRSNAQTLPISSGLSSYISSAQEAAWATHDFSSFVNRSDF